MRLFGRADEISSHRNEDLAALLSVAALKKSEENEEQRDPLLCHSDQLPFSLCLFQRSERRGFRFIRRSYESETR